MEYCPKCGLKTLTMVGISGVGTIYKCSKCRKKYVISEYYGATQR